MGQVLGQIGRAVRRVVPRSKERYFSADKWNDSWSHGYDLNTAEEDARYGTLLAWMRRNEGEGPLLDVGCGDGLLEEQYRKFSNVPIVAFDYSATAIDQAKARHLKGVEFLCADSRTFRPAQEFSLIVFNESLYYVDHYLQLMKDLSLALKPGGIFIVSMHESAITKRIWKNLLRSFTLLGGVAVHDEGKGGRWHIRLLRPKQ
jgi:trans-aconitate methyltransferase